MDVRRYVWTAAEVLSIGAAVIGGALVAQAPAHGPTAVESAVETFASLGTIAVAVHCFRRREMTPYFQPLVDRGLVDRSWFVEHDD